MKYVVILKVVGDLAKRPPEHKKSHSSYPLECREFDTKEQAEIAYPCRQIMSADEYKGFKAAMNLQHGVIQKPKRWYWPWG
jgi:hypothetical protein